MNKYLIPFMALLILGLSACKDDEPIEAVQTDLTINFTPKFDGEAMSFADSYTYDGQKIRFNLFTMYISDLALVKENGEMVELDDIDYLDFSDADINKDFAIDRSYAGVEVGDYKSLRIGIGVTEDLNATTPSDYSPADPLGNSGVYWSGWSSYIFLRLQGDYDNMGDDSFATDLTYHVGANPTYRELTIETPISVTENGSIDLTFDIHDLFMMNGQPYDVVTNSATPHGPGDIVIASALMDNITNAIQISQ